MLQKNSFNEIKQVMIANEQELIKQNSLTDKTKPLSVEEAYDDIDQLKRFPSTNPSCVELCKFVSKLSIAVNEFNKHFEIYANNISNDKEQELKTTASEYLTKLNQIYIEHTKDLSNDEKLITRQMYYDLIVSKIREYPTITMHSPDNQIKIAGHIKTEVTSIVNNLQEQMKEARQKNPNSWFVGELYDYLVNSNNISGHAKESLEKLKSQNHQLETQVTSQIRNELDKSYVINDSEYAFKDDYIAIKFFESRQEYYSQIAKDNNEIFAGLQINRTRSQNEEEKNFDTYKITKLEDNSYKTFIGSQAYSSYRAYKINEAIKVRQLNTQIESTY